MANVQFSEEKKIPVNIEDLNYIPGYKDLEQERRANENIRILNEKERIKYYEDFKIKVSSGIFKGETGAQGPKGDTGNTGAVGPQGPKGETGLQGPKGDTGAKGDPGDKGLDGFNPIVSIEYVEDGIIVSITDNTHTETKKISNGYTPKRGIDYLTENDKQEFIDGVLGDINSVLSSLTTVSGVE